MSEIVGWGSLVEDGNLSRGFVAIAGGGNRCQKADRSVVSRFDWA